MGEEVMVPGSIETKLGVTAKGEAWRLITPLRLIRNTNEYNASSARSLGIWKPNIGIKTKKANGLKKQKKLMKVLHGGNESKGEASGTWLIDSGCSNHMLGDKALFWSIEEIPR